MIVIASLCVFLNRGLSFFPVHQLNNTPRKVTQSPLCLALLPSYAIRLFAAICLLTAEVPLFAAIRLFAALCLPTLPHLPAVTSFFPQILRYV